MATIARCLIAFFFVASGSGKIFAFRQSSTILASIVTGTDQIVHMIKNIAIIGGLVNFVAS